METHSAYKSWMDGIPYELAFWNNIYRWDSTFEGLRRWSRLGRELELEGMDVQQYLADYEHPIVLDVGCGMSFAKGSLRRTPDGLQPLDIRYIDPLAPFYNAIRRRHHRDMPDVEFGMMEHLAAVVAPGTVHLVIIQNALDHSADPLRGILSALDVLAVGGCLYLNHHPDEAETEHYKGFHKFNICTDEQRRCIIWNKDGRTVVDDIVAPFATIETQTLSNGFVVSLLRKTAPLPSDIAASMATSGALATMLMEQMADSFSLGSVCRRKLSYWWYNAIQFFVQALPPQTRKRLRRLVYGK